MDRIYCVRAEFGKFTEHFVNGGYAAVGWFSGQNLSAAKDREDLTDIHSSVSPNDARNVMAGQQLDQVARFLFELKGGDFVITPSLNTEQIYFGMVQPEPNYYFDEVSDTCPFVHRKRVIWCASPIPAGAFPAPIQIAMRSSLSVFPINQKQEFLATIENAPVEMIQEPA
jgi:predicted Mrr-cat superfamily restriction endonuclease